ncbi:MAG: hypothetical protein NTZ64_15895 [Polaromonas sp.]|nr:hypothetical protein [Polaromonas sp.]
MSKADAVTLSAVAGMVIAGSAGQTIDASSLNILALGDIQVYEADGIATVSRIESTGHGAITLNSGGSLGIFGAIAASLSRAVAVTSGGSITLAQGVTTDSGAITLLAANGIVMGDAADLSSVSGNLLLDAGSGGITMTGDTVLNAGSGTLALSAAQSITLGKLRSTNAADLKISSGGLVDGADGTVDIMAHNAALWIRSNGGIGAESNAIETDVKSYDLVNSGAGDIALQNVGDIVVTQATQQASGSVSISTLDGSVITAAGAQGVTATSGTVSLYAGGNGGFITLGADVASTGGTISLTAEGGDVTLGAGVHVRGSAGASSHDVLIKASKGALLNDPAATGWLTLADGSLNPEIDWAMSQHFFTLDQASGQVVVANVPSYLQASHLFNGTVLRAANGPMLQATGGTIKISVRNEIGLALEGYHFSPLSIVVDAPKLSVSSSERKDVSLLATGTTSILSDASTSGARGGASVVSTLDGTQTVTASVDASGKDLSFNAGKIVISAPVRSAGAMLVFTPVDPTAPILIGDLATGAVTSQTLQLSTGSLGYLQDGFQEIVVGSQTGSNLICIGGTGSTTSVTLSDTLHLLAPMLGGEVFINAPLILSGNASLIIEGSGYEYSVDTLSL